MQRLHELWAWLPAFRAVAETEHLPSAATRLQVGPSALSRSVKLLEDRLGIPLFERTGRRLRLTVAGSELLSAVRQAMQRLDDGVQSVLSGELRGDLRIASVGTLASVLLMPALESFRRRHPGVRPHVDIGVAPASCERLLRGELDVLVRTEPVDHPEVCCQRLLDVELAVFCGPGHALADRSGPLTAEDLAGHPFVAPPAGGPGGGAVDGWPDGWPRRVGLVVDQVRNGCDACASGGYLAVLPVRLAADCPPGLVRLALPALPRMPAFAAVRSAAGSGARADTSFVETLREVARGDLGG